jgi:hypothetical protein
MPSFTNGTQGTPGAEEAVAKARHDGIPVSETLQVGNLAGPAGSSWKQSLASEVKHTRPWF